MFNLFKKNYRLFIGLNVENKNDIPIADGENTVIEICRKHGIEGLSIGLCKGVYTYDNGITVYENTVVLTLIDYRGKLDKLIDDLKKALSQQCIMIEKISSKFSFR